MQTLARSEWKPRQEEVNEELRIGTICFWPFSLGFRFDWGVITVNIYGYNMMF
jgi:hypothetical protein